MRKVSVCITSFVFVVLISALPLTSQASFVSCTQINPWMLACTDWEGNVHYVPIPPQDDEICPEPGNTPPC